MGYPSTCEKPAYLYLLPKIVKGFRIPGESCREFRSNLCAECIGGPKNDKRAAQESLPLQAGLVGYGGVETNRACHIWQHPPSHAGDRNFPLSDTMRAVALPELLAVLEALRA